MCLVPSEPYNITVTSKSNTSVQLSWSAPKSPNGIIVLYDVYITNKQSMEIQHDNTTNERFFWQMLQPYTNYSFWIYAKTLVGRGNQSKITIVQTLEGGNVLPSKYLIEYFWNLFEEKFFSHAHFTKNIISFIKPFNPYCSLIHFNFNAFYIFSTIVLTTHQKLHIFNTNNYHFIHFHVSPE